ncbi:domain found in IF2B/IF5-domain-containing protein [Hyaloraphidium curvatum]|nr:domain found in IF2B/IF5-domain-containing protein [Hyaloraphidium curvatum]
MATINIANRDDPFYRYKMPRLTRTIEGRGNGIKTLIPNMSDIAKALHRPATYPTKFFGCELGAQVSMDEKNDRYIVNGAHDASRLQELLDKFIDKFVLCGNCANPETDIIIKNGDITKKCMACGKTTNVDMKHKLVTFILNHPPPEKQKQYSKAEKALKKKKQDALGNGGGSPTSEVAPSTPGGPDGDDDDEIAREAARLVVDDKDEHEWSQDVSAAAIAARQKEALQGAVAKLAATGDDDDDEDGNPLDAFGDFVKPGMDDEEIAAKAKELGIRGDKALVVLSQVLFDAGIEQQLPKRKELLASFLKGSKAEKAQKALLGGIERLVGEMYPEELMPKVIKVLKLLYDEDLIDEEVMLAWADKPSSKYVKKDVSKEIRKKAEPFFKWLREAEEESSDEEDDDEDEDDE